MMTPEQVKACEQYWNNIRKTLPRFVHVPRVKTVEIELTSDEAMDIERFKLRRKEALK